MASKLTDARRPADASEPADACSPANAFEPTDGDFVGAISLILQDPKHAEGIAEAEALLATDKHLALKTIMLLHCMLSNGTQRQREANLFDLIELSKFIWCPCRNVHLQSEEPQKVAEATETKAK